jgi:simple sugar transport system permease protein
MDFELITTLFRTSIRMATPILLASLGGALTFHAGIINVAMEGLMLISAFFSVVFSFLTGSALLGIVAGIIASILVSLLYSVFVSFLKANNFAIGFAINILVSSLTLFLMRIMFQGKNAFNSPNIASIMELKIRTGNYFLDNYIFNFSILTYLSIFIVFLLAFMVYKTSFGLRLRVCGEMPEALKAAGIKVGFVQLWASVLCGALCGLAGAQLSLYNVRMFSRDMTGGRGFVALAAILISGGKPKRILFISLLFGVFDALSVKLQSEKIAPQFALMLPYVMSVVVLLLFHMKSRRRLDSA